MVLEPDRDPTDPRPLVLTENRWAGRISSADYSCASPPLGSMTLPKRVEHRQPRVRRDVASALRSAATGLHAPTATRGGKATATTTPIPNCAGCVSNCATTPPRRSRIERPRSASPSAICASNAKTHSSGGKIAAATNSLARTFDRIVGLLTERGFIVDADGHPQVTDDGRLLARIYSESDLLVAECLRSGTWKGLAPGELAAVVSAVVYESRGGVGRRHQRRGHADR